LIFLEALRSLKEMLPVLLEKPFTINAGIFLPVPMKRLVPHSLGTRQFNHAPSSWFAFGIKWVASVRNATATRFLPVITFPSEMNSWCIKHGEAEVTALLPYQTAPESFFKTPFAHQLNDEATTCHG
jgi:hypothetical protein